MHDRQHNGSGRTAAPTIERRIEHPATEPPTLPIRRPGVGRHREGARPGMTSVRHWLGTGELAATR